VTDDPGEPGSAETAAALACYRHPDRETYVRCVRCDRPICPDCMQSASVGFQCPECVRSGAKTVRQPRTAFGGLMPTQVGQVTRLLIALNVVAFVIQQVSSDFTERFALLPARTVFITGGAQVLYDGVANGEYYRLLTGAFLHANILHIFFNMYALLIVGPTVEAALGRLRFTVLYLISALGGSTLAYLLSPPHGLVVGASGAIFGLFGALFVVTRRMGAESGGIVGLIGINLFLSFALPNISWQGHLGGLITGAALAAAFAYAPRDRRDLVQAGACVLAVVVIVAAIAARTSALTS
jgi:membrane associated rhomboid family serine protease